MEGNTPEINIQEIMQQIQKEAEKLRYEEPVSFEAIEIPATTREDSGTEEFDLKNCENIINRLNTLWNIPYGYEISGNPLKKLIGRFARKINKPTGAPMAQAITTYNADVTQSLNEVMRFIRASRKKEEEQDRQIFELEAEIRQLKNGMGKKA